MPNSTANGEGPLLEVVVTNAQAGIDALSAGAHRLELCSSLSTGGLTPSPGTIQQLARNGAPLHVLIRPREGNFIYAEADVLAMVHSIDFCQSCGVDGVVIGALTSTNEVDLEVMSQLIEAANGMSMTFHRAFDLVKDPLEAIHLLNDLGFDRVLTSGQAASAFEGRFLLRQLVEKKGGKISIMPGCGVNVTNAKNIIDETGADELHFSAMTTKAQSVNDSHEQVAMGKEAPDELHSWPVCDVDKIRNIRALFDYADS